MGKSSFTPIKGSVAKNVLTILKGEGCSKGFMVDLTL